MTKEKDDSTLKVKFILNLIGIEVYEDLNTFGEIELSNEQKVENGFCVYLPSGNKKFRFIARNIGEKVNWLNEFQLVKNMNKYQEEINRYNLGKTKPVWIPDVLCKFCCECRAKFSTINRKHHCRACGYIFCSKCSKMLISLEFCANKKSRVCNRCYDQVSKSYRFSTPSIS